MSTACTQATAQGQSYTCLLANNFGLSTLHGQRMHINYSQFAKPTDCPGCRPHHTMFLEGLRLSLGFHRLVPEAGITGTDK